MKYYIGTRKKNPKRLYLQSFLYRCEWVEEGELQHNDGFDTLKEAIENIRLELGIGQLFRVWCYQLNIPKHKINKPVILLGKSPINKSELIKTALGFATSLFGKMILESQGYDCDYKIDGVPLEEIQLNYTKIELKDQLKKAIEEERYEDAGHLTNLLKTKKEKPKTNEII